MDVSRLRISDIEGVIRAMLIGFASKGVMQSEDVVREPILEFLHISFTALPFEKLPPSIEQVFCGNDIVEHHDWF